MLRFQGGYRSRLHFLYFTHPDTGICTHVLVLVSQVLQVAPSCHRLLRHQCGVDESMGINISCYHLFTFLVHYVHFAQDFTVVSNNLWEVWVYDRVFFQLLPHFLLRKKSWKQLSVMGMSLRIGMRSPISLTLKPRVGITLIAASHDSLKPQLSVWVFILWQLSDRLRKLLGIQNILLLHGTCS